MSPQSVAADKVLAGDPLFLRNATVEYIELFLQMTKIAVSTAMASLADMTDSAEHHRQRSEFIRGLVQQSVSEVPINDRYKQGPPRIIVQYWHDLGELPGDIEECIASWTHWRTNDFTHCLFDERRAKEFIAGSLGARHERTF